MLTQLPDQDQVVHVIDRCRALIGDDQAEVLLGWLALDWEQAASESQDRAVYTAAQQLARAVQLRRAGHHALANMCDHLAEAAITGWRGELVARTTDVPEHP